MTDLKLCPECEKIVKIVTSEGNADVCSLCGWFVYSIDYIKMLIHDYGSTRGSWCIDRDPKDVDIQWIRRNAVRLEDMK